MFEIGRGLRLGARGSRHAPIVCRVTSHCMTLSLTTIRKWVIVSFVVKVLVHYRFLI